MNVPKSNIVFICLHSGWTLRVITSGCEMWQVKFYLLRRLLGVKTEGDGKAGKVAKLKKGEILMAAWLARSKLSWSIWPSFGSWTARVLPLPYDKCGKNQKEPRCMRHVLPMSFPSHPGRVSHIFFKFWLQNFQHHSVSQNIYQHLLSSSHLCPTIPGIPGIMISSWYFGDDFHLHQGQHWIHSCRWQSALPRQWP